MKINNRQINSAAHLYEKQQKAIEVNKKAELNDIKKTKNNKADEVIISKEAKELAKVSQLSQTQQEERLASLKAQIKAGTYQPKTEDIAESIIKRFFGAR
ncbi:MAG: flagellar biosynthesis anti-sigma factor FlgM [Bacillota bacterium]|nr:flagellar biosynthesis anti-sigma factor FlgM [Bacillota bacterium]MDD4263112.1 flagellar biosynthesis anti-sigma factor FlgM [Bacillota bacterium]